MFYNHKTWASEIGSETADPHTEKNTSVRGTCLFLFFPAMNLGVNYAPQNI